MHSTYVGYTRCTMINTWSCVSLRNRMCDLLPRRVTIRSSNCILGRSVRRSHTAIGITIPYKFSHFWKAYTHVIVIMIIVHLEARASERSAYRVVARIIKGNRAGRVGGFSSGWSERLARTERTAVINYGYWFLTKVCYLYLSTYHQVNCERQSCRSQARGSQKCRFFASLRCERRVYDSLSPNGSHGSIHGEERSPPAGEKRNPRWLIPFLPVLHRVMNDRSSNVRQWCTVALY